MKREIGVFIPTWNAGPDFAFVLDAIERQQDVTPKLFVIDSGSTDGTLEVLSERGIRHEVIDQADFNHGETRNRGVEALGTELVALLSQDAEPVGDHWLSGLAEAFDEDGVVGAYAAQRPRPGCHPFQRINLARHMSAERVVREPLSPEEFGNLSPLDRLERIRFDNVASMVRREALLQTPFPSTPFGEDLAWARAVVTARKSVVFCPDVEVLHSHGANRHEFSTRVHEVHATLRRLTDFVPLPHRGWWLRRTAGQVLRLASAALRDDEAAWPKRIARALTALPFGLMQMEAMYRGAKAARYEPPR